MNCHGTRHGVEGAGLRYNVNRYCNDDCRCTPAVDAKRIYEKRRRCGKMDAGLIDPTGTRRRLQAMQAAGHTCQAISDACTVDPVTGRGPSLFTLRGISQGRWPTTQRHVAEAVRAAYSALSESLGTSPITARRAKSKGWLSPAWWDDDTIDNPGYQPAVVIPIGRSWNLSDDVDEVAVERACKGDGVAELNRAEKIEAIRQMTDRGVPFLEQAKRLGVHDRQVHRYLAAIRSEQAVAELAAAEATEAVAA